MGSIDQRLSQSVNLGPQFSFGQSASTESGHMTPNLPSGYPSSFFGYQPTFPSRSSNQQSGSDPRSASSNILSTSPSLYSTTHNPPSLSVTPNPSSASSNPRFHPLPPRPPFPSVTGVGFPSKSNRPEQQSVNPPVNQPVDRRFNQRFNQRSDRVLSPRDLYKGHLAPVPPPLIPFRGPIPIQAFQYQRPHHKRSTPTQMPNLPRVSSPLGLESTYEFPARTLHGSSLALLFDPSPRSETLEESSVVRDDAHRWFRVSDLPIETPIHVLAYVFSEPESVEGPFLNAVSTLGYFYVGFTDLYDAQATMDAVRCQWPDWKIENVSRETFTRSTQIQCTPLRNFEDFVQVFVYAGFNARLTPSILAEKVKAQMSPVGTILRVEMVVFDGTLGARVAVHELRVRFSDCRHAANAVKCLNGYRDEVSFTFILKVICF